MSEFKSSAAKIELTSYEELFGDVSTGDYGGKVYLIPISEIKEFEDHPFRVIDDDKMDELVKSIKEYGILTPGVVRKLPDGSFQMISGHRRRHALILLGLEYMPVVVCEYDDDEATIAMVDSNIQREEVLPSEKASAYKMKYDALRHRGCKANKNSYDMVGELNGDNGKTVQRYIRLTYLVKELLDMVDAGKLGFIAAVELSHLSKDEQILLWQKMKGFGVIPNGGQATRLKDISQAEGINEDAIGQILGKKEQKVKNLVLKSTVVREYFPEDYSSDEMVEVICNLLEKWKQGGEC